MINDVTNRRETSTSSLSVLAELTPRTVVLDMLAIAGDTPLASPALVRGGDIMGFQPVAMRVAVSRLAAQKLIESPRRGEWQLAGEAPWARERARWQNLDALLAPWQGGWWVVATQKVSRSSRARWRNHERALWQRGFREAHRDLFVRPANLTLDFAALHQELMGLGMHPDSVLMEASQLSFQPKPALWDARRWPQAQAKVLAKMLGLIEKNSAADDKKRCEHFLRMGRAATRTLNTDPLLPEEWTGPSPRRDLVALMPRFIATGRNLWFQYLNIGTRN